MSEHETAQHGIEAARVLDNPAFKQAMRAIKSGVIEQWKACPVRDREGQMLLLQLAKLTDKFEATLVGMIESGKFSQHQIEMDKLRDESRPRSLLRRVVNG